jgi:hypothetical protein
MVNQELNQIRRDYVAPPLIELEMMQDPIIQLELWLDEAINTTSIRHRVSRLHVLYWSSPLMNAGYRFIPITIARKGVI